MKNKYLITIILIVIMINAVLGYRTITRITKEIKILKESCHLSLIWRGEITKGLGYSLLAIEEMKNDIEELKKKTAKTFY